MDQGPSMKLLSPMLAVFSLALALIGAGPVHALELSGTKAVVAIAADGSRVELGSVRFSPKPGGEASFELTMEREPFTDHFLSMREFKCLPGKTELSCYVPYPYANPRTVSLNNLAWLEHSLLFFYKTPAEFGAKLWNGIYFELSADANGLTGKPQAIDLNAISAPPKDLSQPPFRRSLRDDIPSDARWIRAIRIE